MKTKETTTGTRTETETKKAEAKETMNGDFRSNNVDYKYDGGDDVEDEDDVKEDDEDSFIVRISNPRRHFKIVLLQIGSSTVP